jgi:raffinose/stachyose/melibiose transport system permease protein
MKSSTLETSQKSLKAYQIQRENKTLSGVSRVMVNAALFGYVLTAIYPPIWMIYSSLKTAPEFALNIFSLPSSFNLQNFITILHRGTVYRAFFNSLFASVISVSLIVTLSFVVAYFLARYHFPGRNAIYMFFMFGVLVPVYALLVPVFITFSKIGMLNNQFTIIPPMVAFSLSSSIFLIESYIRSIPEEIEEAAFMDGSNLFNTLRLIILPMCSPIISTVVILNFMGTWNEFAFPLVLLRSPQYKTIPLWLNTFKGEYSTDYVGQMAALVIASLPVILLYLFFNEKIIQGMTSGALKG